MEDQGSKMERSVAAIHNFILNKEVQQPLYLLYGSEALRHYQTLD